MGTMHLLLIVAGIIVVGSGLLWIGLRAAGHTGPHRDIAAWSVASPDARSEDRRTARATERSARVRREASRLADEMREYERWRGA